MAQVALPTRDLVSVVWRRGSGADASLLLRREVSRVLGVPGTDVRLSHACPRCGSSDHGRPVLTRPAAARALWVSVSRADDVALVAVSSGAAVGVDVERRDAARFTGYDEVALHPGETATTAEARATTWVRKESLLKATGDGLRVDLRRIRLGDADQPPRLVAWSAPSAPPGSVWMHDVAIPGHVACLSVLTGSAPRLRIRQAAREGSPR